MKRNLIIVTLVSSSLFLHAQRRIIHVPAPQPPTVPIDGGLTVLLLGGGLLAKRIVKQPNQ
ncbi:hypothetical protein OAQ85_03930 [Schleiferiaceae bacterium]|jgi:hypothetical protein|nr:hypothetical protein [Flavobacteriales bacterium]MDC1022565.1 hypothetical protein [Schleiferiaceae bacterium]|tara:strand:+ start:1006 stop:1188 length:183 start_codon:yes stop_codon:yes gene_type:complete